MSTITTLPSRAHMHHPIALLMGILCNTGYVHPDEHRLRLNNQAVGKEGCHMQVSDIFSAGMVGTDRDGDRDRDHRGGEHRGDEHHEHPRRGRWDYDWRHRRWFWRNG